MDTLRRVGWAAVGLAVGSVILGFALALFPALVDALSNLLGSRPPVIIKGGSLQLSTFTDRLPLKPSGATHEFYLKESALLHVRLISFCAELQDKDYREVEQIAIELGSADRHLTIAEDTSVNRMFFRANALLKEDMATYIWSHPDAATHKVTRLKITGKAVSLNQTGTDLRFVIWVK